MVHRLIPSRPVAAKPMKTLEQREAEYAEARRRILGSDYVGGSPAGPGGVSEDTQKIERYNWLLDIFVNLNLTSVLLICGNKTKTW